MMGSAEAASSPVFPSLDPIVVDDEMENPYRDTDLDFFDSARLQMNEAAGQDFDDLFARSHSSRTVTDSESVCLSPSELSVKRPFQEQDGLRQPKIVASHSPAESPDNSTPSSSSDSPRNHIRNTSVASSTSVIHSDHANIMPFGYATEDWINSELASMKEETSMFGFDPSLPAMEGAFPVETDLESSNKAMDAAFDFESAASSPSPLKTDSTPQPKIQKRLKSQMRGTSHSASRQSASPVCTQTLILPRPFTNSPRSNFAIRPLLSQRAKCPVKVGRHQANGQDDHRRRFWRKVLAAST